MTFSSTDSGLPLPLILLTAIIGAIIVAALWKFRSGSSSGSSSAKRKVSRTRVLFMGPMGSGKTAAMFKVRVYTCEQNFKAASALQRAFDLPVHPSSCPKTCCLGLSPVPRLALYLCLTLLAL